MSIKIPEQPLLIYPSIARRLGVDAALLLHICHQRLSIAGIPLGNGCREVMIPAQQWRQLTEFWNEAKLEEIISILAAQKCLMITLSAGGTVRVVEMATEVIQDEPAAAAVVTTSTDVPTSRLPVLETPPAYPRRPLPSKNSMRERGPAPAFGGSIGWSRQKDELQQLFDQHEERNQKLHTMFLGWRPSELFFSMLPRHQIPVEFVEGCLDEFVLYYIDKEHKESNWDQKLLSWVKREWVKKQTRDSREQRNEQQRYTASGINDENPRRDTKENRKRVTAAIMDIKDTDW